MCYEPLVTKRAKTESQGKPGKKDKKKGAEDTSEADENFKHVKRYQPLLYLGFTESQELVVVERPWLAVMQKLPPPLFRQKYGV